MGAPSLAHLIEQGRSALLARYGHHLTAHQRRALDAMARCRTGALGATVMACEHCSHKDVRLRSCGHRSCPRCQQHAATDWLERQRAKLLPAEYFMATFTLPSVWRDNQDEKPATIKVRKRGVAGLDNQVIGSGSQAPSFTSVSG